ncbi:MAG: hypothetical protein U5K54_05490 [Cytophagales bacterium]|nr:hypothetical protein [Cytophagales bacterium]
MLPTFRPDKAYATRAVLEIAYNHYLDLLSEVSGITIVNLLET